MERVILESPYAGDKDMIKVNEMYGRFCMHDMLVNHNESPYASHLLYTQEFVLRDDIPNERKKGIKAGFFWRDVAERTVFYCDLGMTSGMEQGFKDVQKKGRYEMRWLPDALWNKFTSILKNRGLSVPKRVVKI
jgi:hypothetical protein